ncbi:Protein of unknown function [Salinimicrobium catena]|uniref:DUF2911 domain-containing protein n=1 Tax=Salinimicrobium catena TaxID=390640 RepID=A0A1H5KUW3_9FLAO|nr:DUF2911 domain-containing protein [Salinimicrobium catena]SDL02127.1 Protein of unknown function [Salinimicrobium catena]SEE68636.1 Protein of unknown function [Salinimicrobium catena]
MKNIAFFFFAALFCVTVSGQIQTPVPSPAATVEQQVGLTNFTLKYSRPAMRGRTIFGDLVPYGQKWRTGANNNTTIAFDTKVTIAGKELTKGTYAIYTIPDENEWEVIFYTDTNNWGLPQNWDETKVALKTTAKVQEVPIEVENFTILFDDLQNDSAQLIFAWGNTVANLKIDLPTDEIAMKSIDKIMKGPSAGDYFAAAVYFHDEEKDLQKAYEWITKAVEMGDPAAYWVLRRKSLIEAELGKKEEAIATAKKSLAAAEKAGNQDYVKMNKESIEEWEGN